MKGDFWLLLPVPVTKNGLNVYPFRRLGPHLNKIITYSSSYIAHFLKKINSTTNYIWREAFRLLLPIRGTMNRLNVYPFSGLGPPLSSLAINTKIRKLKSYLSNLAWTVNSWVCFYFFVSWPSNFRGLFTVNVILAEEEHCPKGKDLPNSISAEVNVMASLGIELVYFNVTIQPLRHAIFPSNSIFYICIQNFFPDMTFDLCWKISRIQSYY